MKTSTRILVFSLIAMLIVGSSSCKQRVNDAERDAARILFEKQLALIKAYTDSLEQLDDTTDREPVLNRFRDKLTMLNLEYPHAADGAMTEGENDTLFMATQKLLQAASARHSADSIALPADSIAT